MARLSELLRGRRLTWAFCGLLATCGASLLMASGRGPVLSVRECALIANLVLEEAPIHSEEELELAEFGRVLFFDARLSGGGEVSCSTCHVPERYFSDGRTLARGKGLGRRNTPTVIGAGRLSFLNWDGSADSVWSQALMPMESDLEMGGDRLAVAHLVAERYSEEYARFFGELPDLADEMRFPPHGKPVPGDPADARARAWMSVAHQDRDAIDRVFANVGRSLAAYIDLLEPGRSGFDRFAAPALAGGEPDWDAMSDAAIRGMRVFIGRGGCVNCHNGSLLTDSGFHNIGLPGAEGKEVDVGHSRGARRLMLSPFRSDRQHADDNAASPMRFFRFDPAEGRGAFKTPSLRNVAETAPYGHAGQFGSLSAMVSFYTLDPVEPQAGKRDRALTVIEEADVGDLVAFLEELTGDLPDERWLARPASMEPERAPKARGEIER